MILLPITDEQAEYADSVASRLKEAGFRVEVDKRSERLGKKIAEAETHVKPPYILIMGKRDVESGVVSVRKRYEGDLGAMSVDDLVNRLILERDA